MSSGQPYKKPTDVQMYRNEYILDLDMRTDLDKINYDANMNYIKTGALPPQSQMADNRSVNDKLLDLVYVKKHIVDTLSPLSNQQYAQNVVEGILSNPNNVDNKLLIFTSQRAPEIAEQLKKIYSIGIKGDSDDSMKLVSYIVKLFRVQHNTMLSLREVQNRFTNDKTTQPNLLGGLHNIILQIISYMEYMARQKSNIPFIDETRNLKKLLSFIPDAQGNIVFNIRGEKLYTNMSYMKNYIINDDDKMIYVASKYMAFLNSDFPNIDDLNYLFKEIIKAFETYRKLRNQQNKSKLYTRIKDIYNIIYNEDIVLRLEEFEDMFARDPSLARMLAPDETVPEFEQESDVTSDKGIDYTGVPFSDTASQAPPNNASQSQSEPVPDLVPNNLPDGFNNEYSIDELLESYDRIIKNLNHVTEGKEYLIDNLKNSLQKKYGSTFDQVDSWYTDNNMGGNGLFKKKRGRGRPRGSGVAKPYKQTIYENLNTDKGLEESRRFVKFGKYLINMNKLNDNILSLKIPSGGTVVGHPVTKVTSSFSKIVKNMINNVNPSFKDLQSLSDTEKNYLYNISKKANILDKFSIPTPDISEDDKDINEYEILKGEILAGNDNKDLIKKFKAKIVKMSNKGLLNKRDVSSILHDLLNLNL